MSSKGLLERLEDGVVLGSEGYLFELERRGYIKAGPYVPEVVLDYPEAVKQLHRDFLRAGADVMVAFTYYGHRAKMRTVGKEDLLEDLNRQAVRIAREVAAEGDALVAGNLSNTWDYDPENLEESEKVVRAMFEEQTQWAVEEGVDFIIAETFSHYGEAKIALDVIQEAGLPSMITYAATREESHDGYSWAEACRKLSEDGADVVGLNCSRGPATMMPYLKEIREAVDGYVAAQPVPYRTDKDHPVFQKLEGPKGGKSFPVALDPHVLTRYEMADFAKEAEQMGINYIGICCGAGPHHVRAMAEALGRTVPASEYSPELDLHPVLGAKGEEKAKRKKFSEDFGTED